MITKFATETPFSGILKVLFGVGLSIWLALEVSSGASGKATISETETSVVESIVTPDFTPGLVLLSTDLAGAYYKIDGRRLTIEDVRWGMSHGGALCAARIYGSFEDGTTLRYDAPEGTLDRTIGRSDNMIGCSVTDGEHKYHISEMETVIQVDGYVKVSYFVGVREDGEEVKVGERYAIAGDNNPLLGAGCCTLHMVPEACSGCSGDCGSVAQGCPCANPGQACLAIYKIICRGKCAPGEPGCPTGSCNGNINNCGCN